jgi:hypothetical protein
MNDVETDVERKEAVRIALDSLASGRGVLVVGDTGSGRSHLVRSVVAALDEQVRRRVWVYDDGRRFEVQVRSRVAEAMARVDILPVVVVASGAPEPWLRHLADDGGLTRIRLEPFSREAMLRLSRQFLGGPLDVRAVPALIPERDGGDLVVFREAFRELQAARILVESDGVWMLDGPIPPIEIIRRLTFTRMGFDGIATEPAESVIDVIGLAHELGLARTRDLLRQILGEDPDPSIEWLKAAEAIDLIEHDGTVHCRIHDPVLELMVRHSMGRLRRRRLSNAIVESLSERPPGESRDSELVALTRLALPLGWEIDAATLTRAAETALRASRLGLAAHLATAALAKGASVEATFVLASAESQSGRSADALERLAHLESADGLDPRHERTRRELVRLLTARLEDPISVWNVPTPAPVSAADVSRDGRDDRDEQDTVAELVALSSTDRPVAQPELAGTGMFADEAVVLQGERMAFEASVVAMGGQTDAAVEILLEAEAMLRDAGADTFRVRWGQSYSRMWDQSFDRTLDELVILGDETASLGRAEQETLCRWSVGLALGHAGRVSEAIPELRSAMAALERYSFTEPALLAHVSLAKALALAGHGRAAAEAIAPVLEVSHGPLVAGWVEDAQGWMQLSAGQQESASQSFIDAAATHGAHGYRLFQMIALSGAARSGAAARVVDEIDGLAGLVDGGVRRPPRQAGSCSGSSGIRFGGRARRGVRGGGR